MNNITIIIITLVFSILIAIIFSYLMRKRKSRHSETLESDFKNFKKAVSDKHIKRIAEFGEKLIWNECLTMELLNDISDSIKNMDNSYSELKHLENLIYNKYLDWNKVRPPRV